MNKKQGNLLFFFGKSTDKTVESQDKKKKSPKKHEELPAEKEKPKNKKSESKSGKRKVDQISDEDFDEQAPSSTSFTATKKQKKSPQTKAEVPELESEEKPTSKSKKTSKQAPSKQSQKSPKNDSNKEKGSPAASKAASKEKKNSPERTSPRKKVPPKGAEIGIEDVILSDKENEQKKNGPSRTLTPEKVEPKVSKEEKLEVPVQESKAKAKSPTKPTPSPSKKKLEVEDPKPEKSSPSKRKLELETATPVEKLSPSKKKLELETAKPVEKSSPSKKGKSPSKNSKFPTLEVESAKDVPMKETLVEEIEDIEDMEMESTTQPPKPVKAPEEKKTPEKEVPMVRTTSGYQDYMHRGGPPNKGTKEIPVGNQNCLYGKQFLLTGVLDSLERDEAADLIQRYGGSVAKSVTKKLTHLVVGDGAGAAKLEKAKQNPNIQIINEDGLLDLIRNSAPQKLPKNVVSKTALLPPTPEKDIPPAQVAKLEHHTSSKAVHISPPSTNKNVSKISPEKPKLDQPKPTSLLWTDKWKPKSSKDLVANPGIIDQLKKWLSAWKVTSVKSKSGKVTTQSSHAKAALISGQPGIGKTSAAILCAQECGYEPIEFNASDVRSKKALQEGVDQIAGNRAINEFYTAADAPKTEKKKKTCLIMDEVDGMSSGDRGGMKELIALINKTTIPIICICNDRSSPKVKSLANHCLDLRFRKPTIQQAAARVSNIARAEGFAVEPLAIEKLLESTQCDIRQTLNLLQMWRRNMNQIRCTDDLKRKLEDASKTSIDLGPFDVLPQIFSTRTPITEKFDLFFVDSSLIPLMVQENYLNASAPRKEGVDPIEFYANAADSISEADILERSIMREQNWELQSANAALSTIRPASILGGQLCGRIGFPVFLGKTSSTNKRKRLLKDIQNHTSTSLTGDKNEIRLQYLPLMKNKLLEPLMKDGADGVEPLLSWMDEYGLTKDDFDAVMEVTTLTDQDPLQNVPSQVKSTFTRKYNQTHLAKISSKKSSAEADDMEEISIGEAAEETEGIIKDSVPKETEEAETEDISADKLIKVKQTTKREGKSTKQKKEKDASKPPKKRAAKAKK